MKNRDYRLALMPALTPAFRLALKIARLALTPALTPAYKVTGATESGLVEVQR